MAGFISLCVEEELCCLLFGVDPRRVLRVWPLHDEATNYWQAERLTSAVASIGALGNGT